MSNNGSQPTSMKYQTVVDVLNINHVTTSYSNPIGNADIERFMKTFKEEVVYINEFDSFEEAQDVVDNFMKFYNHDYSYSTLGNLSPIDFETQLKYNNAA
ncbi:MAG: integrase core domain-containing protein [Bacteroidetes bacterium]|nr:integrase core domain-containing protein [Bacteroidota bacterium]